MISEESKRDVKFVILPSLATVCILTPIIGKNNKINFNMEILPYLKDHIYMD
jgi:hypothetical protein